MQPEHTITSKIVECVCLTCGKTFETKRFRLAHGRGKYCSRECAHAAYPKGEDHGCWKGGSVVPRVCEQCGQTFQAKKSNVARGYGRYCSRSCSQKARTGERNPKWKGGRTVHHGYVIVTPPGERSTKEHRAVMAKALGRPLLPEEIVHHINGDKADNRPENLAVLTASEHSRLHNRLRGQKNTVA